jgi:small ligand-binding sensory domain FIST
MQFISVISTSTETDRALAEVCAAATWRLKGARPDLVLLFVSSHHAGDDAAAVAISAAIREHFPTALVVGTTARGVFGDGREVEHHAALALTAAVLPGVEVRGFHLAPADVPLYAGAESAGRWRNLLASTDPETDAEAEADAVVPDPDAETPTILLFPDPFCPGLAEIVAGLDAAWPAGQVVGGLASGFREAGQHRLFLDDEIHAAGVVGLLMYGNLEVDVRVAQGCHPVGQPLFVTGAHEQRLLTLDGRPAVDVLQETYENAPDADRERMRQALFIGLGLVGRDSYDRGDFLVRHILGAEAESGALLVQGAFEENQVVQFHVRDADTSTDDLRRHLSTVPPGAAGVLVFSCVGRGEALYGMPDADTQTIAALHPGVPVGGFFCNGEVGAVNGRTYLHGYTASLCFVRPRGQR